MMNDATEFIEEVEKIIDNKSKKSKKDNVVNKSFYVFTLNDIDYIAEQVFDIRTGIAKFAVYNTVVNQVNYWSQIEHEGLIIKPIRDEEVVKQAIYLPTQAEEYISDTELDNLLKKFITKWLDIEDDFVLFAIWNIKRSWVFDRFHTLNYLRAQGDTGQGKTRFLDTLGALHYKPIATSGASTVAPIFRVIDKWKGSLIIDEADFNYGDESQEIIKIINQGYEKNKPVMRCDQNDPEKVKFYDVYCPKILGTRRGFKDLATESRCITIVMKGTTRKDIPYNLNTSFSDDAMRLRNKLLMWRFKNYYRINPDAEPSFDMGDLEPRVQQIVSSFVNLFSSDTPQMQKFRAFIENYQTQLINDRQDSFEGQIVGAIIELLNEGKKYITAKDLIEKAQLTDIHGKDLKPRALSSPLKSLGLVIDKKAKRIDGVLKKCIVIEERQIQNLSKRYGYCVTVVTVHVESIETVTTQEKLGEGCLRNYGNNGNTVTTQSPKKPITPQDIFSKKVITIDIAIKKFLEEGISEEEAEQYIKHWLERGEICELVTGYFALLE